MQQKEKKLYCRLVCCKQSNFAKQFWVIGNLSKAFSRVESKHRRGSGQVGVVTPIVFSSFVFGIFLFFRDSHNLVDVPTPFIYLFFSFCVFSSTAPLPGLAGDAGQIVAG